MIGESSQGANKTRTTGKLESLKHGKKDVDEARKGGECGVGFEVFQDLQVGDQIQAVEEVRTQRSL
jgi:translation initiation factor IF-2